MAYKASDEYVKIEAQELTAPKREGFTVVEWGGTEVADSSNNTKSTFLEKADKIKEYSKNHLESAFTQYELNTESGVVREKWEALLSEVYKYLEKELPDEYEKLQENELEWLSKKENAINEAAEDWKGGSGEPMARNMAAIHCMEERFFYLISLLK